MGPPAHLSPSWLCLPLPPLSPPPLLPSSLPPPSMIVRSEVYSASGELRVVVTRVWVRAEAGLPLALGPGDLTPPADSDRPPATTRITNPIGHAVHATRIPAGRA